MARWRYASIGLTPQCLCRTCDTHSTSDRRESRFPANYCQESAPFVSLGPSGGFFGVIPSVGFHAPGSGDEALHEPGRQTPADEVLVGEDALLELHVRLNPLDD